MNILGKRYLLFLFSLLVILPGLIIIAIYGLPLSIDFTGGSLLEMNVVEGTSPQPAQIITAYDEMGLTNAQVQTTSNNTFVIRSRYLDNVERGKVIEQLQEKLNIKIDVLKYDSVGPVIGAEVTQRGILAVIAAALGVVIYITFAFRGVKHAFRYSVCAILAELHDILILISIAGIGAKFFGWQIDSLFLSAFLTVIGFSVQDTIVVFDRMRENSSIYRKLPFETLVNHSVVQTLQRSINTQLMTSEFLLLSLALFGGVTLREFSIILLIGLFFGTYSSIFVAASLLVVWENKEWKTWFKHTTGTSQA